MHRRAMVILVSAMAAWGAWGAVAAAQVELPTTRPGEKPVGLAGLKIDVKNRTIEMESHVVQTDVGLELLVCAAGTKEHEAILATSARARHLHAALLAVGLQAGKSAQTYTAPDGKMMDLPPMGATLEISLRYADADGIEKTVGANEWLLTARAGAAKVAPPIKWVFVGSKLSHGYYLADETGEIISVANFPAPVIDVPFESSTEKAMLSFTANPKAIPPRGTKVTVIIKADLGPAEVARAVFDIDRFGRYKLDGVPIEPGQIAKWAAEFKAKHAKPYIVINKAPRSMAWDAERLRRVLAYEWITDIEQNVTSLAGEILPRGEPRMDKALAWWAQQFADYKDLLVDPGEEAEIVLRQIEIRREELGDILAVWSKYEADLRKALDAYRVATEPAARPNEDDKTGRDDADGER